MTEAEWTACADARKMLLFLRFRCGVRKLRLFSVACYRREWCQLDEQARIAVETAEQLAYDRERIAAGGLRAARADADTAFHTALCAAGETGSEGAKLLRCIFGRLPFRKVQIEASWRTPSILALARCIYEERRFEDLPVLADALDELGCRDEELLSHCRGPGPHARGCFVIDLLLGKE